jgi:hypothetical protein
MVVELPSEASNILGTESCGCKTVEASQRLQLRSLVYYQSTGKNGSKSRITCTVVSSLASSGSSTGPTLQ